MSKSKSFGGVPLTMSWYTGKFPGSDPAPSHQQVRQSHHVSSGPTPATSNFQQQQAPVIDTDDADERIELKLAPVSQGSTGMVDARGGGGWGDDYGKDEGVGGAWNKNSSTGWGKDGRGDRDGGGSNLLLDVNRIKRSCTAFYFPKIFRHLRRVRAKTYHCNRTHGRFRSPDSSYPYVRDNSLLRGLAAI